MSPIDPMANTFDETLTVCSMAYTDDYLIGSLEIMWDYSVNFKKFFFSSFTPIFVF